MGGKSRGERLMKDKQACHQHIREDVKHRGGSHTTRPLDVKLRKDIKGKICSEAGFTHTQGKTYFRV